MAQIIKRKNLQPSRIIDILQPLGQPSRFIVLSDRAGLVEITSVEEGTVLRTTLSFATAQHLSNELSSLLKDMSAAPESNTDDAQPPTPYIEFLKYT